MTNPLNFEKSKKMRFLFCFFLIAGLSCTTEEDGGRRFRDGRVKTDSKDRKQGSKPPTSSDSVVETEVETTPTTSTSPRGSTPPLPPPPAKVQPVEENMPFPVVLNTKHTSISIESGAGLTSVISAEPQANPVDLVAGKKGQLSISTQNGKHYLTLSLANSTKTFHYDLVENQTTLKVTNGKNVNPRELLAKTTGAVIFYIKQDKRPVKLCFSINSMPPGIKVINNFPKFPGCD